MNITDIIKEKLAKKNHITVNIVGDSVTLGLSHCTPDETYTACFAKMIAEAFPEYTVRRFDGITTDPLGKMDYFEGPFTVQEGNAGIIDFIRNGIGGNSVKRAHNRITDFTGTLANGQASDITTLMFGINDALRWDANRYVTPDVFKQNYKNLIDEIRERDPETTLIIMSATTNDHPIDKHCEKSAELAREEGIYYIDHFKTWADHYDEKMPNFGHGDWLSCKPGDACHPSPIGAIQIAKNMLDEF